MTSSILVSSPENASHPSMSVRSWFSQSHFTYSSVNRLSSNTRNSWLPPYGKLPFRPRHLWIHTSVTGSNCASKRKLPLRILHKSGHRRHATETIRLSTSPKLPSDHQDAALPYVAPTTGPISYLPQSWIPFAELARLDKPAGTYYLFFPCLFSTLMAASYTACSPLPVLTTSLLFFSGALIMRGAGCTINDLWDRNLDPHVARTRLRPIARGAISPSSAIVFTGIQLLAGLGILMQFPVSCLYYGIPSLLLVGTYPLAKRVTYYPQFVLGLTFSWGAFMGFPALGIDLLSDGAAAKAAAALYASCISWTVLYDMIYAHMDIKDDAKVGIKSIALRHEKDTKLVLSGLAIAQVGLLAAAGSAVGFGAVFLVGSCGTAAATLSLMIWRVNLKEVRNCWWWFKNGAWFTGGGISAGLFAEYMFGSKEYQRNSLRKNDTSH